jgi:hypothetical protein
MSAQDKYSKHDPRRVTTGSMLLAGGESITEQIVHVLHHKNTQILLLCLLVIDVLFVVTGIALEIEFLSSGVKSCTATVDCLQKNLLGCGSAPFGDAGLHTVEATIGSISIFILCLFLMENLLLVFAKG